MKKFSITALSLLLMLFFVSCSDDDNDGGGDNTNTYTPNTGTVLYFESHELDENNNETGETRETDQTIIGNTTLSGKQATILEDYDKETGKRDTVYISEDNDFMYFYMEDFNMGNEEEDAGGFFPEFDFEPQWIKICSFTQFEWNAFEYTLEGIETELPLGGQNLKVEMTLKMTMSGKKKANENFIIRDKNETVETLINEITNNVNMEFKLKGGLPLPIPFPAIEQTFVNTYSLAKGFGIVKSMMPSQKADPEDPISQAMPGNISKMVDYKK